MPTIFSGKFMPYIKIATPHPVLDMVPCHQVVLPEQLWNNTEVIINGLSWPFFTEAVIFIPLWPLGLIAVINCSDKEP